MVQDGSWEWLLEGFKIDLETKAKPKTVDYYTSRILIFIRWTKNGGGIDFPTLVTKRDVQSFLHWLTSATFITPIGNGAQRQNHVRSRWPYYRSLKRFFEWAVKEGYLDRNPMDGVELKPSKDPPVEPYQPDQLKRMLKILDEDWRTATTQKQKMLAARDRAVLFLFLESGLRLGELTELRLQSIDLNRQRITVIRGKMDKSRIAGFGTQTKKALWRYLGLRPSEVQNDAVWLSEEGRPLTKHGIQQIIRRLKKDAGLQHVRGSVHKLRHTFATAYLRHTRDMKGCRLLLGHSTLAMTERYTQFIDAEDALTAYGNEGPLDWLSNNN